MRSKPQWRWIPGKQRLNLGLCPAFWDIISLLEGNQQALPGQLPGSFFVIIQIFGEING